MSFAQQWCGESMRRRISGRIGPWIKGCRRYFLQAFKDSGDILVPQAYDAFSAEEMRAFMELVRPYAEEVSLRGIDYPS